MNLVSKDLTFGEFAYIYLYFKCPQIKTELLRNLLMTHTCLRLNAVYKLNTTPIRVKRDKKYIWNNTL